VRDRKTPDRSADIVDAGLLQHRDYIRSTLQSLSAGLLRELLQAMDDRRNTRRTLKVRTRPGADMSPAEMQREIIWRLETLPSEDAEAIAALVRRLIASAQ
jgi:hypothetical protein